jgi:hypothetical protein
LTPNRRTFVTIAEGLDVPAYALKRLLNHAMTNDVTAGYIITDVERLRAPMEKIHDFMLKAADIRASAPILQLVTSVGTRTPVANSASNGAVHAVDCDSESSPARGRSNAVTLKHLGSQ